MVVQEGTQEGLNRGLWAVWLALCLVAPCAKTLCAACSALLCCVALRRRSGCAVCQCRSARHKALSGTSASRPARRSLRSSTACTSCQSGSSHGHTSIHQRLLASTACPAAPPGVARWLCVLRASPGRGLLPPAGLALGCWRGLDECCWRLLCCCSCSPASSGTCWRCASRLCSTCISSVSRLVASCLGCTTTHLLLELSSGCGLRERLAVLHRQGRFSYCSS